LILLLAFSGNVLFLIDLRKNREHLEQPERASYYKSLVVLQLDFDLVIISFLIFFSGGFSSPLISFIIFYIIVSTFLNDLQKALRNTITSIALIFVIAILSRPDLNFTSAEITNIFALDFLLVFAFAISGYLSENIHKQEAILKRLLDKTHELSIKDGLTGLFNQNYFFTALEKETERSLRYQEAYSLIIFDVDFFKNYNDHNGHIKGSQTLQRVGQIMISSFRTTDILAKYGGDEFVVILPKTDKIGAYLAAERLRERIEREKFPGGELQPQKKITISLGLASFSEHGLTPEAILEAADKALYFAKETGRNRSIIFSSQLFENETSD
jgi:diguanylate cyclase (GGDEF)-like protein